MTMSRCGLCTTLAVQKWVVAPLVLVTNSAPTAGAPVNDVAVSGTDGVSKGGAESAAVPAGDAMTIAYTINIMMLIRDADDATSFLARASAIF